MELEYDWAQAFFNYLPSPRNTLQHQSKRAQAKKRRARAVDSFLPSLILMLSNISSGARLKLFVFFNQWCMKNIQWFVFDDFPIYIFHPLLQYWSILIDSIYTSFISSWPQWGHIQRIQCQNMCILLQIDPSPTFSPWFHNFVIFHNSDQIS